MVLTVFSLLETRIDKSLIMKIILAAVLLMSVSCVGHLEIPDVKIELLSNECVQMPAATAMRFSSSDTVSAREKLSRQWDNDYMMGSGHSTLGCNYEK